MKKLFLVFFSGAIFASFNTAQAQVFEQGSNHLNAGYGIGLGYGRILKAYDVYDGYKFSGFGPAILSFERGVTDNIGIGASISYSTYGASWVQKSYLSSYDYSYRWTTFSILARGAYHFRISNDKFDPYVGLGLGFMKFGYKWTSSDPNFNETTNSVSLGSPFGYQIFAGARYMFTDNIGAYAEIGFGLSVANFGLTFKF
jgi:opacity protein-like surface antigen